MRCAGQTDVITKPLMGYFNTQLMVLRCRLVHNALVCTLTPSFFMRNFSALGTCRLFHNTLSILCAWQNIKQITLLSNIILFDFLLLSIAERELSHVKKSKKKQKTNWFIGLDISMSLLIYCNHNPSLTSSILSSNHTPKPNFHIFISELPEADVVDSNTFFSLKDRVKPCLIYAMKLHVYVTHGYYIGSQSKAIINYFRNTFKMLNVCIDNPIAGS